MGYSGFKVEQMSRRAGVAGRRGRQRCTRHVALLAAAAAAVVVVTACGYDSPSTPPPDVPEGSEAVVIQFSTGGGLAGPCCDPWEVPDITAYGDGRVVVEGTAGQVPELRQATVSRSDLAELLAGAREAGLLEEQPPDTGTLCCDLGYTDVVIADAATTHEFEIVGLGHEDNINSDLSDEQVRARQALSDLRDQLVALTEQSGTGRYTPVELAIYVSASTTDGSEPAHWPLDQTLAEAGSSTDDDGGCLLLTDERDIAAVAAAADVNPSHVWSSAGQEWSVFVRPLLPHERGCP
jgi:hypothetical protein